MKTDTSDEALDALAEEKNDNPDWESVGFAESYVNRLLEAIEALRREREELEGSVKFFKKLCQDEYVRGQREALAVAREERCERCDYMEGLSEGHNAARTVTREQLREAAEHLERVYVDGGSASHIFDLLKEGFERCGLTIQDSEQGQELLAEKKAKTVTREQISKAFEEFHDVIGYHAERAIHEEDVNDFIKALGLEIQDGESE